MPEASQQLTGAHAVKSPFGYPAGLRATSLGD